ncbi:hypothetical protein [Erythrobacter sp. F6033]|uniref:hypothetical protein n=1 Tax=Erythrobacter sp. F6033 TaxID=2926401 RepID=UPI001FF33BC2|nr:hypothetical protein [Erythrobacter sp. F6033]MCK0129338.1 hypothetical protein [Erythrobacter sp. F6033]
MSDPQTNLPAWKPILPQLDDDPLTRLLMTFALFMAAAFIVFIPAWVIDTRVLDSAPIWTKPQKFNVSFVVHFITLALIAQQIPRAVRSGMGLRIFAYLAGIGLVFEFIYLNTQAARGVRSHFNNDGPFEQIMYAFMGLGAVLLMTIAVAIAVQVWRKADRSRRGLWLGTIVGCIGAFITTVVFGFYMSGEGRYVGAPLTGGGEVIPFFGWSREYGDLRPAHFVSMHMLQTIPFVGWLADRQNWNGTIIVLVATALQIALATFLFMQALSGQPFWPA